MDPLLVLCDSGIYLHDHFEQNLWKVWELIGATAVFEQPERGILAKIQFHIPLRQLPKYTVAAWISSATNRRTEGNRGYPLLAFESSTFLPAATMWRLWSSDQG